MKQKELPSHEAAKIATIDYYYNSHRCLPSSFSSHNYNNNSSSSFYSSSSSNNNTSSSSSSSSSSSHNNNNNNNNNNFHYILPRWIPDIERNNCKNCLNIFNLFNRRHHCRYCGEIFCLKCIYKRCLLPKEFNERNPQLCCYNCYQILEPLQKKLIREYANHTRINNLEISQQFNLPFSKTLGSEIRKAMCTIQNLLNDDVIQDTAFSLSRLNDAKGIVFLTVMKGGFIFAPKIGTGLVMSKLLDGRWSAPSAISSVGMSWGALVGIDITDYVIVLHDLDAVRAFTGNGQVSLSGELKVSIGGIGRTGAGELLVGDKGLATAMSYCHSQGLFAGISFDGSVILSRDEVNFNFYGRQVSPYQLLSGEVPPPNAAQNLYLQLQKAVEECDRFYGITSQERSHQDMLAKLQLQDQLQQQQQQQQQQYSKNQNRTFSNNNSNRGENNRIIESKHNDYHNNLSKGIGDQYY